MCRSVLFMCCAANYKNPVDVKSYSQEFKHILSRSSTRLYHCSNIKERFSSPMAFLFSGDCHGLYSRHEIPPYISQLIRHYSKFSSPSFIFIPQSHPHKTPPRCVDLIQKNTKIPKIYNNKNEGLNVYLRLPVSVSHISGHYSILSALHCQRNRALHLELPGHVAEILSLLLQAKQFPSLIIQL